MIIKQFGISDQEFYQNTQQAVRGFVNRVFPTFFRHEDVEDMVQETSIKAWQAADSYDPSRSLFNWLWTIAKNVVLTQAKRLKRERDRFISFDSLDSGDLGLSDERLEQPADACLLTDELQEFFLLNLPRERDRQIFGYLLDGLDDGEIAHRLEISKPAAYTAVCRVRSQLRNAA